MAEPAPDRGVEEIWPSGRAHGRSLLWRARLWLRSNSKRVLVAAVVVAAGLAAYLYVSSPTRVQVAVVKTTSALETLGAAGKVEGERTAKLGLDVAGVVGHVYVKEGDTVPRGALVLSLDKAEMNARVVSSRNAVSSAMAELARASRPPLGSEVRQARAELAQARSVGAARVAQAQARLDTLQSGPRSQEVKEAEAELQRRRQMAAKVEKDRERIKLLVDQGAVAETELEQADNELQSAKADVTVQEQRLSLLKAGPKPGEIAAAQAALEEAKASRDTSIVAAQERLNTLQSNPRREDIEAAQARVNEARSQLVQAEEARLKADLRAPFEGVVSSIPVEQGQSVSPGQPLTVIHEMQRPIIEVETDEDNLSVLAVGQRAVVSSDAFPGRTFDAILYDLGSQVNPERGTINIKLRPTSRVSWLRPDLTVDVNIITRRNAKRTVLPPDTVARFGGHSVVLLVRDGRTVAVPVTTGAAGPSGVAIYGNVNDGDKAVRDAANVGPGVDVVVSRKT